MYICIWLCVCIIYSAWKIDFLMVNGGREMKGRESEREGRKERGKEGGKTRRGEGREDGRRKEGGTHWSCCHLNLLLILFIKRPQSSWVVGGLWDWRCRNWEKNDDKKKKFDSKKCATQFKHHSQGGNIPLHVVTTTLTSKTTHTLHIHTNTHSNSS